MPSYDAGEAFLSVLPSLRGFTQRLKRELTGVRVEFEIPATVNLDRRGLAELRQVSRTIPAIVLDADASPADRELAAVKERIDRLADKTIGIDISGDAARAEIDSIQSELQRLGRDAPSIGVRVDAGAAEAALAGVHRSAAQLDGRRVNVRVIVDAVQAIASIASIALAVNEFANRKYRFTVEADTFGAVASIAALVTKVSALGGLAGIVGGFGGALGGLGAAGAVAAGGLGAAVLASLGVGKALSALGAQQDAAGQDAQQSAKQQQSAAFAIASAQDRVKQAAQSASRARAEGARSVADAEKSASKQVAQALSAQAMAQRTLRQATSDLEQEQSDLTRAWEDGRRSLQDLQSQVTGNSIDQRQAAIDLKDAEKDLATARASKNADAIDRATVAYDRQKATVDQLAVQGQRLASDNAEAQKKGVAGTDQVVSANERIAAATLRQSDAAVAARAADAAVVEARVSGADSVARAQEQADQRIADADHQRVEAQRALTQALAQTGDAGQSSADQVSAAFAKLSPEAAAFARYLFGLKPLLQDLSGVAASEFFPPLQAGLGLLVAQAPLISGVVKQLAGGMGAGLNLVLTQLASPFWTGFFQLLGGAAGKIIPALFQVLMNLAGAAAILVTDLLPLAPAAFSFLDEVSQLLVVLSPFIAQLLGGLIPAASAFLSALYPLGPVLAALQPILLVLGQAFATVLMAVLQALAPILVALTPLIQTLATTFANQLVGAIQAGTPFLVWLAGWLSANPSLVIGVITVLGGLAAAFKPLLFVLGIVVTALHAFLIRFAALSLLRLAGLEATVFGRVLMTLLSPLNLVRTVFGFLVTMVGRLFSPMQLISGAGRLLGSAIMWIGRAILGALGPFGIILTILGLLYSSNEQFRTTVQSLLQVLLALGVQLMNALMPAFQAVMDALAPLVPMLVGALVPVFQVLAGVLADLIATVLPPLVGILQNVVVPVIILLAQILSTVLVWVIKNVVVPAIQGLAWFLKNVLVPAITWLANTIIIPVFKAIGAFIDWAVNSVILPAVEGLVAFWQNVLGPAILWLWTSVIQPVFGFIAAAANVLYQIVMVVLITPLILAFKLVAFVVSWLWTNAIQPAFQAIGTFVGWVWTTLIKPIFDALVWFIQKVVTPAVMWLWNNVISPAFRGIGNIVQWVWLNVIKPAWDAIMGGLDWLGRGFQNGVDAIGRIWNGLRNLLAMPVNFVIDTVWNNGIREVWNFAAGLLPGIDTIDKLKTIPTFKDGGLLTGPGTGTSDSILAMGPASPIRVSNGEFIVKEDVTRKVLPFLSALNDGNGEALQAAGGLARVAKTYRGTSGIEAYAAGGPIDQRITEAKKWLSGPAQGIPYVWGGGSMSGMDCSGMQAAVTHILSGRPPTSGRIGTTASMPWGGFVSGLGGAYAIGNKPSDHMAGTLAGDNVEQHGPNGNPFSFPSRWGADNGYFNQKFHLQQLGGQFVSGGSGGGGNWILDQIRSFFDATTNPVIDSVRGVMGNPPPQFRAIPPALAISLRDSVSSFLFGQADSMGGGDGVDISGIAGPVRDQVQQVATRFGWGTGPEWDAIVRLVQKESSWDPTAANKTTSARGLFQKMTSLHGPVEPTPAGQAAWGLNYIRGRYGTPSAAWAFHQRNNSYDEGGIGRGIGLMWKGTGLDERVLDPQETQAYPTLTRLTQQLEAGRLPVPTGMSASQYATAIAGSTGRGTGPGNTYNFNAATWDEGRMLREIDRRDDARTRTT